MKTSSLLPSLQHSAKAHGSLFLAVCFGTSGLFTMPSAVSAGDEKLFSEVDGVIPLEKVSRRKWDSAQVADFDKNGHMDLLLTEHGNNASIYWNEGGTFSEPQKIIGGDTHGVAAGDYDLDGRMDIIIYPGGGGGKKPDNPKYFTVNKDRTIEGGEEFEHFERSRGRAAKFIDGDNDGSLDLALSAFPLKSQNKEGANQLFDNLGDGQFEYVGRLPAAKWMGFRLLTTDFNSDGDMDLIFYGGKDVVAAKGEEGLSFSNATREVFKNLQWTNFVSSICEIDYDNDGDFDLFVTRADHPFSEHTHYDEETETFAYYVFASFSKDIPFQYDLKIDGDFEMVNHQTAYPTYDVFAGAESRQLDFGPDKHPGVDYTLTPEEAMGWPEDTSSNNGLYIGYLGDGMWRIGGETRSATSGVVRGVVSSHENSPRKELSTMLLENRDGVFVDVSDSFGMAINEQTTSAVSADFNNDGWSDLFIVRHGNPATANEQLLYLNNKGKSFTRVEGHGIIAEELGATGAGAEVLDYDNDGDIDIIYCAERGRWHLLTNHSTNEGANNFVVINVGSAPSGKASAHGAVLTLKANGQTYKRVVGATSSWFGHTSNHHLHVGLGETTEIESAEVVWTNGESQTFSVNKVNQMVPVGVFE